MIYSLIGGNMNEIFNKLIDEFEQKINGNDFSKNQISDGEVEFSKGEVCFKISYLDSNVVLSSSDKKLCEWHLNDSSTNKDISEIVDEFCELVIGKKSKKVVSKKLGSDIPSNETITFDKMIEKVLQFFPDQRDEYVKNLSTSTIKDKVLFIKNNVIPQISDMVKKAKCDNRTDRLFNHLSNSYVFGDDNTKCIITMMFFNSITGNDERKKVRSMLPYYLRKIWDFSWKFK